MFGDKQPYICCVALVSELAWQTVPPSQPLVVRYGMAPIRYEHDVRLFPVPLRPFDTIGAARRGAPKRFRARVYTRSQVPHAVGSYQSSIVVECICGPLRWSSADSVTLQPLPLLLIVK